MTHISLGKRAIAYFILSQVLFYAGADWHINLERIDYYPSATLRNEPFDMIFSLTNTGSESITSVDIAYQPDNGTKNTVHHIFSEAILPNETDTFTVNGFLCDRIGSEIYGEFKLKCVNGETNYGSNTYLWILCADELIPKRIVVEEGASINCGYCPLGYESMEHMHAKYTDGSWIGISIQEHGDMASYDTFRSFWDRVTGKPTSFINRNYESAVPPYPKTFEEWHDIVTRQYSEVDVEASIDYNSGSRTATIETRLRFTFDYPEADFRLAYIITEDNLGPYYQRNYYSNGSLGEFMGWENKPSSVPCIFNDIARPGSIYDGIAGLIPNHITAGETYIVSKEIDLSGVNSPDNSKIAVLVTDGNTGKVLNAVQIPVRTNTSGINLLTDKDSYPDIHIENGTITVTTELNARLYTLDGRIISTITGTRTLNVPRGFYLLRSGEHTHKILVK